MGVYLQGENLYCLFKLCHGLKKKERHKLPNTWTPCPRQPTQNAFNMDSTHQGLPWHPLNYNSTHSMNTCGAKDQRTKLFFFFSKSSLSGVYLWHKPWIILWPVNVIVNILRACGEVIGPYIIIRCAVSCIIILCNLIEWRICAQTPKTWHLSLWLQLF